MNFLYLIILLIVDLCTILFIRKKYHRYHFKLAIQYILLVIPMFFSYCWINEIGKILVSLFLIAVLSVFSVNQVLVGYTSMGYFHRYSLLEIFLNTIWVVFWAGIISNLLWAITISEMTYLLLGWISYYVFSFRGTEFELGDIQAISTMRTILSKYRIKMNEIVFIGSLTEFFHIGILLLIIKDEAIIKINGNMRGAAVVFSVCSVCLLIFTKLLEKANIEYTTIQNTKGVMSNLLLQLIDNFRKRVDENDDIKNLDELEKYPEIEISVKKKLCEYPNILVIMNESYADLRVLEENAYGNCYKDIDKLVLNGMKQGLVYTSVFGGNTAFSEFEFLTGNSSRFYSGCPYSAHVIKNGSVCNTFISYMKRQGYTTIATHPYNRRNWRRPIVYSAFGFDRQFYMEDFEPFEKFRGYASDRDYYRKLIEMYKNKPEHEKYFSFNITMQNHGGYENTDGMVLEKFHNLQDANVYLNLIKKSSEAFLELTEFFANFGEPTAILFFGDHQPKLSDEYYIRTCGKTVQNMNSKEKSMLYLTPWYIWTNYKCSGILGEKMSLNYLFEYFLNIIGFPRERYGLYLDEMKKEFPIITRQYIGNEKIEFLKENKFEKILTYQNIARKHLYDS